MSTSIRQKLYIHIGLTKTGSSFLQSQFARNTNLYKSKGLIYPDLDGSLERAASGFATSGNAVAFAASGVPDLQDKVTAIPISEWGQFLESHTDYLISSEAFSACDESFFKEIEMTFADRFEIIYIAFARNLGDWLISSYLQSLKGGQTLRFTEFLAVKIKKIERIAALLSSLPELHLFNYDQHKKDLLSPVEALIFGARVSPMPQSESSPQHIAGTEPETLKSVNPSPNLIEASVLWLSNQLGLADFGAAMEYIEEGWPNRLNKDTTDLLVREVGAEVIPPDVHASLQALEAQLSQALLPGQMKMSESIGSHRWPRGHAFAFSDRDVEFIRSRMNAHLDQLLQSRVKELYAHRIEAHQLTGQIPNDFDVLAYLVHNPDVLRARVNPFEHFLQYGKAEGRTYK